MDNMQKIPVFFTFDANYLLAAKVAIHSMMKHASRQYWYELYVFHTTLSPKAQQSLRNRYNAENLKQSAFCYNNGIYRKYGKEFRGNVHINGLSKVQRDV